MSIRLELPYPPSVNTYWRSVAGRVLISKAGRMYRAELDASVFRQLQADDVRPLAGRLDVSVIVHPPDKRRRDLDNVLKALLDALQHAGIYQDDSQIDKLTVERAEMLKGGNVIVCVGHYFKTPQTIAHTF
jgi:crossover junction endodeoxyribonuclease RusA